MNENVDSVAFLGARPNHKATPLDDDDVKEKIFISDILALVTQYTRKCFKMIVRSSDDLQKSVYYKWVLSENLYSIHCDAMHVASARTHHRNRNFLFVFLTYFYFDPQNPHENDTASTCCIHLPRPLYQRLPLAWTSSPATWRSPEQFSDEIRLPRIICIALWSPNLDDFRFWTGALLLATSTHVRPLPRDFISQILLHEHTFEQRDSGHVHQN